MCQLVASLGDFKILSNVVSPPLSGGLSMRAIKFRGENNEYKID